ncbi:band 4.1-like protein 5 [Hemicordylus capensis]|uniref:band 4.1-like protein 5 n=1 Tax=Hemicordylus capensis TaxID=884348 RepID=UPI0023036A85|nr:band 4.1-like protein 5 [Hemicordylus capensis]
MAPEDRGGKMADKYFQVGAANSALSMPLVIDLLDNKKLLETCVDNAVGLSPPGGSAGVREEAGFSFSPQSIKEHPCEKADPAVVDDSSLKLKQLEAELGPVPVPHSNINVNVNKQEEVVKLTEKCLNNVMESPGNPSMRLPTDIKSNILKAQTEAVHKITREDSMSGNKNTNLQDAAARSILLSGKIQNSPLQAHSPVFQEPREGLKGMPVSNTFVQNELNEDNAASSPEDLLRRLNLVPAEEEAAVLKNSPEDPEILLTSQTENLIDFTEAMPRVSSPSTVVPRWLVPSGLVSNGPLGNDIALALKAVKGNNETLSVLTGSPPPLSPPEIMASPVTEDAATRPKCLLTTEL